MLVPASQLLVRNEHLFKQGKWLLANAEDSDIFNHLPGQVSGFHQYLTPYAPWQNQSHHQFGVSFESSEKFDGIILYMPKAKAQAQMLLANLANYVKPNGCLMLVGENKQGIKSSAKLLSGFGEHVVKLDAARHCSLFSVVVSQPVKPFVLDDWAKQFTVQVGQHQLSIYSLPGIFSHTQLDDGTRLLLESIEMVPGKQVLDFACGAGVVGCYLAKLNPAIKLHMSDVSAIAVHCARKSAQLNNIEATVIASDGLAQISERFDGIYTNPPFHTGIKTDYSITRAFLQACSNHLKSKGSLTLVANAFLDYPEQMREFIAQPTIVKQSPRFKVYHCQRS